MRSTEKIPTIPRDDERDVITLMVCGICSGMVLIGLFLKFAPV